MEKLSDTRIEEVKDNCRYIADKVAEAAVKSGRKPEDVRLMAVTKTVSPLLINAAFEAGITLMGENRVQEFLDKEPKLNLTGIEKHLIGHLQSNKVKRIVGKVDMIQSVDSVEIAREIAKRSLQQSIVTPVLLEVNIGEEDSKFGFNKENLEEKALEISGFEGIKIKGLMTIPPFCEQIEKTRQNFYEMNKIYIDFKNKIFDNINMSVLSMGMSADYEAAVLEGSTLVRVGSAMFGPRIYR